MAAEPGDEKWHVVGHHPCPRPRRETRCHVDNMLWPYTTVQLYQALVTARRERYEAREALQGELDA